MEPKVLSADLPNNEPEIQTVEPIAGEASVVAEALETPKIEAENLDVMMGGGVGVLAMAASFVSMALPEGAENSRYFISVDRNGEYSWNPGPITELNGVRFINGKQVDENGNPVDEADEDAEAMERSFDQRHNVNQSYEEWSNSDQSFGNVHMTGKDWERLKKWLSNPANKKKVEDDLKDDGYSDEEIKAAERVVDIMGKPPSQWTAEEREFIRQQEQNQRVQAAAQKIKKTSETYQAELSQGQNLSTIADKDTSASLRSDRLATDGTERLRKLTTSPEQNQRVQAAVSEIQQAVDLKGASLLPAKPESSAVPRTVSVASTVDDNFGNFSSAPELKPAFVSASNNNAAIAETAPTQMASATPPKVAASVVMDVGFG